MSSPVLGGYDPTEVTLSLTAVSDEALIVPTHFAEGTMIEIESRGRTSVQRGANGSVVWSKIHQLDATMTLSLMPVDPALRELSSRTDTHEEYRFVARDNSSGEAKVVGLCTLAGDISWAKAAEAQPVQVVFNAWIPKGDHTVDSSNLVA